MKFSVIEIALLLVMMDRFKLDVFIGRLPASLHALTTVGNSMIATPLLPLDNFASDIP